MRFTNSSSRPKFDDVVVSAEEYNKIPFDSESDEGNSIFAVNFSVPVYWAILLSALPLELRTDTVAFSNEYFTGTLTSEVTFEVIFVIV